MSHTIANSFNPRDSVVVGVDGKKQPSQAVLWAADIAQRRGVRLILVYSFGVQYSREIIVTTEPGRAQKEAAEKTLTHLADILAERYPDVAVELVATVEDASAVFAKASHEALVVIGATTMSSLAQLLLGKTSSKTISAAHGPVAIVPENATQDGPVILGLDLDRPNPGAIHFAFEIASWLKRPLEILNAWVMPMVPPVTSDKVFDASIPDIRSEMKALIDPYTAQHPDVEVTYTVKHGEPFPVLKEASTQAQVLVVGSRGHVAGIVGVVAGSTSRQLMDHTACPLIVVTSR